MANRVFYASQGVSISGVTVPGAQSVGVQSNFNLEQAFQLGRLGIYDNIVTNPEVTVTVSKVLDGEDTIYKLATGGGSLISNANDQCNIVVGVGSDTASALSSTSAIEMTGMYVTSVSYTLPVDGNFTEEVSFVGDNKSVSTGVVAAPTATGNTVLRRQHYKSDSTLPVEVSGQNVTNITINADLGRETMFRLGQFGPFHRFVNFPLEVTCEFEVSATGIDTVEVSQDVTCTGGNLPAIQPILINLCDPSDGTTSYSFNLGASNRLTSVNYQGGDTGGGNATITFSYTTYNELTISG
jgi:hypothetical protein